MIAIHYTGYRKLEMWPTKLGWTVRVKNIPDFKTEYMYEFTSAIVKHHHKPSGIKHPFILSHVWDGEVVVQRGSDELPA